MPLPEPDAVVSRLRAAGCVFAEEEAALLIAAAGPAEAAGTAGALESLVAQRVAGRPLEHLLGWAEFHGRRIAVDPGVFVPRRRTQLVVDVAVRLAGPTPVLVDLCCGCGALAAVLGELLAPRELHAADVDPAAVANARRNLPPPARVHLGDLFQALPADLRGRIELLVANPPYVPAEALETMPPEARLHEPATALLGGPDGLDLVRRLLDGAASWLAPGGHLLFETSERQLPAALELVRARGLQAGTASAEELGATVVHATRPAQPSTRADAAG